MQSFRHFTLVKEVQAMTTPFCIFLIIIFYLLLPSYAFAHVIDPLEFDREISKSHGFRDMIVAKHADKSINHGSGNNGAGDTGTHFRARRIYHDNHYNYYHLQTNPSPPLALEQRAKAFDASKASTRPSDHTGSSFGIGMRIVGFYPGSMTSSFNQGLSTFSGKALNFELNGGIGFYTKLRLIRWVSVEAGLDITYGKDKDSSTYLRVPISLGLQFHVFDYGMLNVYGVAAATISLVRSDSQDHTNKYKQYGGQFGAGLSIIFVPFELGIDLRYTLDTAPTALHTAYGSYYFDEGVQHGVVFAVQIGLAF